jgi:hypothetical protein
MASIASEPGSMIHLLPIAHDSFSAIPPSASSMYQTPSISSTGSSMYDQKFDPSPTPSRSPFPTMSSYQEPSYDRYSPPGVNRLSMTVGHFSPYPTSRSRNSVPQVTGSPSSTVTGKVTRQKRTDRHEDMPRSEATKETVEAKRRYHKLFTSSELLPSAATSTNYFQRAL